MSIDKVEDFDHQVFTNRVLKELVVYENQIQLNFDGKNYIHVESFCELIDNDHIFSYETPFSLGKVTFNLNKLCGKLLISIEKDYKGTLKLNFEENLIFKIYKSNSPYYESYQVFTEDGDWYVE